MGVREDYQFALDSGEFSGSMTKALRYTAALNPQASRHEFVAALGEMGVHPGTATKQFALSRKFDAENYGAQFDKDGRALNDY